MTKKETTEKTKNNNSEILDLKEKYESLLEDYSSLEKKLERTTEDLNNVRRKKDYYKNEINRIRSSSSWKITGPLRAVGNVKNKSLYLMKKGFVKVCRGLYIIFPLPKKTKSAILDKLENKIGFIRRIRRSSYNTGTTVRVNEYNPNEVIQFGNELKSINKKIAVHAHVYYMDLLDEFINYLSNIPYEFDLYVSVSKEENIKIVEDKCKAITNVKNIVAKKCQNVGRDFSPMFVEFGRDLTGYDYVCHIHTKKSVRTGTEQDGWRKHMIGSVLGSPSLIRNIFYQFEEDEKVGLIYPETYVDMPYWAHTYLQNKHLCGELCSKYGIEMPTEYFDYSVGSVFWAKTDALKKIFDMNLTYEDFGTEEGKNDGTFAHAIERTIPSAVMSMGYSYLVVDVDNEVFKTTGSKNLWQYCCQTYDSVKENALNHDVVTFDIFDTLITRKVFNPKFISEIVREEMKEKYNIVFNDYPSKRVEAEYNVRVKKKFVGDVDIDEIYEELLSMTSYSEKEINQMKELEKETEIEYCVPREEMLKLFNELKENGKKIVLISDMYLKSDTVTKMLNKCGYNGWDDMIISCEVGLRKDNGTMWDDFFSKDVNSVHFGDNEQSDVQAVCDRKHDFIHVMQGSKILNNTEYGRFIKNEIANMNYKESIMFGLICNKVMFNNPFRKDFNTIIYNYYDYGYSFLAPLFFKFFLWLNEEARNNENDGLLFLAREGYYFEKIYTEFCKALGEKEIGHDYFLASRRAVSVAAIKNKNDIDVLLDKYYSGSLKNLFKSRFGYEIDCFDIEIELPRDKKIVIEYFDKEKDKFFKTVAEEQKEYKAYVDSIMKKYKKPVVVDLGYSGTIQYFLSKLLDKKIGGYYFVTENNVLPLKINCQVESCFSIKNVDDYEDMLFYNSLILESFLTAPYGQLLRFKDGEPLYKDDVITEEEKGRLDEIYEGVVAFFKDMASTGLSFKQEDFDSKLLCKNFYSLIMVDDILLKEIEDDFVLEDKYCSDEISNVFDMLKSRR